MTFSVYTTGVIACMVVTVVITERQLAVARTLPELPAHEHIYRHHKKRSLEANHQRSPRTLSNEVFAEDYSQLRDLLKQAVCNRTGPSTRHQGTWLQLQDEINYDKCKNISCYPKGRCNCCCVQASRELPPSKDLSKQTTMNLDGCVCSNDVGSIEITGKGQQLDN